MTRDRDSTQGLAELQAQWRQNRGLLAVTGVFSAIVNILMLASPLYMMQVYDRVLTSRSEETLVALTVLLGGVFIAMAVLDYARSALLAICGARVQSGLDQRVFFAALRRSAVAPGDLTGSSAQRDMETLQRFHTSPALLALFDLPWVALFVGTIFLFHSWLGWMAVAGGSSMIAMALANQWLTRDLQQQANTSALQSDRLVQQFKSEAESLAALGMTASVFGRWHAGRERALLQTTELATVGAALGAISRSFRLFLQSAMLGLGAFLVLRGELSAGAIVATSILLGRALSPIETLVAHWHGILRALTARQRLADLLACEAADLPKTSLPKPEGRLEMTGLTVVPPGGTKPTLRLLSFRLEPGQALGIIGPSGSGKSTIARVITGLCPASAGSIRLDGAPVTQYDLSVFGRYIGYLPQRVSLFEGTIAENIARLTAAPDTEAVIAAAKLAAAHDMILTLADGYDTRVSGTGMSSLSGGQIQRIGLARALYGMPSVLVLDEPDANLDNDGSLALNAAIRDMKQRSASVVIIAHRPAAIQHCDHLLVLEDGRRKAYGPKDVVLKEMVTNHSRILRSVTGPGVP